MNQEQFEEMCAAYCLGILSHDERMAFERVLASATPEQRQAFAQMMLAARHLPVSGDLVSPSPSVRERIISQISAKDFVVDKIDSPTQATMPRKSLFDSALIDRVYQALRLDRPLVALNVSLILLISTILLILNQMSLKGSISDIEQKYAQQEQTRKSQTEELNNSNLRLADLEAKLLQQDLKIADLEKKSADAIGLIALKDQELNSLKSTYASNQEVMDLMHSNDLKITDLKGLKPYPRGRAKVMFSPKMKIAYIQLANMPPAPTNKDYQLWMMEGKKPVSAGVITVAANEASLVKVSTGLTVAAQRLSAFAITLEPKGGMPKPTGPMYMMGNVRL